MLLGPGSSEPRFQIAAILSRSLSKLWSHECLHLGAFIGNSTVTYATIFAQWSGVSRTLWVPLEPMLNWHFSSRYLDVLCSTDQHDFTFIGEIRCNTNAWYENFNVLKGRNINSIDVKIAQNALRLMETAWATHPAHYETMCNHRLIRENTIFTSFLWSSLYSHI